MLKSANTAYSGRDKAAKLSAQGSHKMITSVKAIDNEVIEFALQNANQLPSIEKIGLIKQGFSKKQLEDIKDESDLDYDTLSSLLAVSRATLLKKKGAEKFDQSTSERIMLLADLISYGQDVFEDKNQFNSWLKNPIRHWV
jgi:putative toxin-antitoxin system antitoxin component (TIGR02293 family)